MPEVTDLLAPLPDPAASPEVVAAPVRNPRRLVAVGATGVVACVALVVAGTLALGDVNAVVRVLVVGGGLVVGYAGLRTAVRAVRPGADVATWLSVAWVGLVVIAAAVADWLPLRESSDISKAFDEATLARPDLFSAHPLGTDRNGLDLLGGLIYGARVSLVVGVVGVLLATLVGGLAGVLVGFYRGKLETVVTTVSDAMLAFPPLVFLLAMVAVLDPSVRNVTVALALLSVPTYIRLTRANALAVSQRDFVLTARAMGASDRRIIFREIVPNIALPVLAYGFTVIAVLIVAEASLSFLGLSIQRPNPTWGNLIAAGQDDFERHPHLVFGPGLVLFVTVFAFNRIGDAARRVWDPRGSQL